MTEQFPTYAHICIIQSLRLAGADYTGGGVDDS
jgi:hypothetical protein